MLENTQIKGELQTDDDPAGTFTCHGRVETVFPIYALSRITPHCLSYKVIEEVMVVSDI